MVPEAQRHKQAKNRLDVIYLIYVRCNIYQLYTSYLSIKQLSNSFPASQLSFMVPEAQRHKQANVIYLIWKYSRNTFASTLTIILCEAHKLPEFKNILTLLHGPRGTTAKTRREQARCRHGILIYSRDTFAKTLKITFLRSSDAPRVQEYP